MNMTNQMMQQLNDIKNVETESNLRLIRVPEDQLSGKLVELYYKTDNLLTREIVRNLFQNMGTEWLRKLLTRDTSACDVPFKEYASTSDYLSMLGSNDDSAAF